MQEARLRRKVVICVVGVRGRVGRRSWRGGASSTRRLPCSEPALVLSSLIISFPAPTIVCVCVCVCVERVCAREKAWARGAARSLTQGYGWEQPAQSSLLSQWVHVHEARREGGVWSKEGGKLAREAKKRAGDGAGGQNLPSGREQDWGSPFTRAASPAVQRRTVSSQMTSCVSSPVSSCKRPRRGPASSAASACPRGGSEEGGLS